MAPVNGYGVSFATHERPEIEVHTEQWIQAATEADARIIAWPRAERHGITTTTHLVRKVYAHRGKGLAAGLGTQKQDMPKAPPAPTPSGSLDGIVAGIAAQVARTVMAEMDAKVNPDVIRDLVAEAMANTPGRIKDLRVHQRDGKPPIVVKGAHPLLERVLKFVRDLKPDNTRLNVELVGPAGCGKTHLARNVAEALGLAFHSTSFTAGVDESELVGSLFPSMDGPVYMAPAFVIAYRDGGVWLGDEWDGADGNVRLKLNEALSGDRMALPDGTSIRRHEWNIVLTASNTWGHGADRQYCTRQAQDASSNDRFEQVAMDYDLELEEEQVYAHADCDVTAEQLLTEWRRIRAAARAAKIPKPTSMRKVINLMWGITTGAHDNVGHAIDTALAGWSVAERRAVGMAA